MVVLIKENVPFRGGLVLLVVQEIHIFSKIFNHKAGKIKQFLCSTLTLVSRVDENLYNT